MRLSISNIAWDVGEDARVATLLRGVGIEAIDVAPSKYFPGLSEATPTSIRAVRSWWSDRGIRIVGIQALLFGTEGLNVFGTPAVQREMLAHLANAFRVGSALGATRAVFGSPRCRDRSGLDDAEAFDIGCGFFRRAGDLAAREGVTICLEPTPPCYGSNFLLDCSETERFVVGVGHRAVRMQFDTGALTINGEDPAAVLERSHEIVGHIHISEPNLVTVGDGSTDHEAASRALERFLPRSTLCIEMLANREEPHLVSIARAIEVAARFYGLERCA